MTFRRGVSLYWRESMWLALLALLSVSARDGWWAALNPVFAVFWAALYYYARRDREARQAREEFAASLRDAIEGRTVPMPPLDDEDDRP